VISKLKYWQALLLLPKAKYQKIHVFSDLSWKLSLDHIIQEASISAKIALLLTPFFLQYHCN